MTMLLQIGPDTCEAHRRLADGRHLAVFKQEPEMELVLPTVLGMRAGVGDEPPMLVTDGVARAVPVGAVEYELVVSDNADEPLKWRRVGERTPTLDAALALFTNFREGDDDRRGERYRAGADISHPQRRAGDERASDQVSQV